MKFLSVFCVVLCLRSGAFLHVPSNAQDFSERTPQERYELNVQKNVKIPISSHEYLNSQIYKNYNEPTNRHFISKERQYSQDQMKSQYIKAPVRTFNDAKISQREEISAKPQAPVSVNLQPISTKNINFESNYANWQQNNKENVRQEIYIRNQGQQIEGTNEEVTKRVNPLPLKLEYSIKSVAEDPKTIFSDKTIKGTSLMPMEDTKFELQPVSPDYIKSLVSRQEPQIKANSISSLPRLNDEYNLGQIRPSYQNPTAEALYNMQRALPYEIRYQQLPKISQGGVNFNKELTNQPNIKEFEKLLQPLKRYMIIHPDGRVEHVDEIEKIIRDHPHYTMINSQDFLNHIEGKNNISGLQIPQLFSNFRQKSVVNQQNEKELLPSNKSGSQFGSVPMYLKDNINLKPNIFQTKVNTDKKDVVQSNNQSPKELNNVVQNNTQEKFNTVVSLPSTSQMKVKDYENIKQSTADVNFTSNSSNIFVGNTLPRLTGNSGSKINNLKTNVIGKVTSPQISATVRRNEKELNEGSGKNHSNAFLYPETPLSSISSSKSVNITENESNISARFENSSNIKPIQLQIITRISTYTERKLPNNISLTYTTNGSESYETSTEATISSANIEDTVVFLNNRNNSSEKNITDMSKNLNVSSLPISKLSNEENSKSNNTGFWFQADEHFWQNLMSKNDTQNLFYFIFVPPNTVKKETKTTLYPNGTILEEVTETFVENGVPREIRTTKIFVNSTSTNEIN